MKNYKKILVLAVSFLGLILVSEARADRMQLSPFAITKTGSASDLSSVVSEIYKFGLGIAGIVAVGMIVVGGIYYATSSIANKKGEGLDMIKSSVIGLILLLGSYVILHSINPNIFSLGTLSLPECPETKDGGDPDPGRNCLPKIKAESGMPFCTGVASATVPDPTDPSKQVPEDPGKNCKINTDNCVAAFQIKDPEIKTMEDVQKATGCYEGIVYTDAGSCEKKNYDIYPEQPGLTLENAPSETVNFCSDVGIIVENFCGDNTTCNFTESSAQVTECSGEQINTISGETKYRVYYQLCPKTSSGNKRIRRWPFYRENYSPGTAQCQIWSKEEFNDGEWHIMEGGKAPNGFRPC